MTCRGSVEQETRISMTSKVAVAAAGLWLELLPKGKAQKRASCPAKEIEPDRGADQGSPAAKFVCVSIVNTKGK